MYSIFLVDRVKHDSLQWLEVLLSFVMSSILSKYTGYVKLQSENGVNYSATNWLLVHHWSDGFLKPNLKWSAVNSTYQMWHGLCMKWLLFKVNSKVMQSWTNEIPPSPIYLPRSIHKVEKCKAEGTFVSTERRTKIVPRAHTWNVLET